MSPSAAEKPTAPPAASDGSAGFTLVEVIVAVAIISILSTMALSYYNVYIDKAKITISIRTLGTVRVAMEDYLSNNGSYPPAIDMVTGRDGQGVVVLPTTLLADVKKDLFSVESYTVSTNDYTLKTRAIDTNHTLLTLQSAGTITRGP